MASGVAVGIVWSSSSSWFQIKNKKKNNNSGRDRVKVVCGASSSVMDPYNTLRIQPGASQSQVRKAYRQLALQYHPDVCRGSNCGVQFSRINEAYDIVMSNLREETEASESFRSYEASDDEATRGTYDPDWDSMEEWMGWESGPAATYTAHYYNPYA